MAVAAQAWGQVGFSAADSTPVLPIPTSTIGVLPDPLPGGDAFITQSQETLD